MLLRRFMQHVKDQNWFAVGLDVVVVIVGIFLGMQVTEWNDARKEQITSDEYMSRIITDLNSDINLFNTVISAAEIRLSKGLFIRDLYNGYQPTEDEYSELLKTVRLAGFTFRAKVNDNTFEALKSSGTLHLIPTANIRDELFSYYGFLNHTDQWSYITNDNQLGYLDALKDIRTLEQADAWFAGVDETITTEEGKVLLDKILQSNDLKRSLPGLIIAQRKFISDARRSIEMANNILEMLNSSSE